MNKRQKDKTVTYTGFSDREQYVEIGESDRMTLKFVKPTGK